MEMLERLQQYTNESSIILLGCGQEDTSSMDLRAYISRGPLFRKRKQR